MLFPVVLVVALKPIIMAIYNKETSRLEPTEINFMGENAFLLQEKEELVSTVMTTFMNGSYYENECVIANRIRKLLDAADPLFAAKLALYARNEGNLRSVTHFIAAYIARYISGKEWGRRFYEKIIVRPDDMSEILYWYRKENCIDSNKMTKVPNSIKKGFKKALEKFDAYQIDKYKMKKREISLIDLVNLFHPNAKNVNAEAYHKLMNGESLNSLYSSSILEKQMSEAGQITKSLSVTEIKKAKGEAIRAILTNMKGMPVMNLIRNLRNILFYAPDMVGEAAMQLTIEDKIRNSRLLPFRFATAYSKVEMAQYENKKDKSSEVIFNKNKKILLDALETAIQIACQNIPKLNGSCAILVDHSGSCRGDNGGDSRVSAFSCTTTAMIGNLFGSMMVYRQDDVYLGLFGDKLISVPIDKTRKILDFNQECYNLGDNCGKCTETGIYDFMKKALKEKMLFDNIIVFSDCQIGTRTKFTPWYGRARRDLGMRFHKIFKKFRELNPMANFVVVNLRQSGGASVFDKNQHILNIAGWSERIFDVINGHCNGWDSTIEKIEAIEI